MATLSLLFPLAYTFWYFVNYYFNSIDRMIMDMVYADLNTTILILYSKI